VERPTALMRGIIAMSFLNRDDARLIGRLSV